MAYVECTKPKCGNPVFATGLCRKHYEQGRLERAAPCSFEGCPGKAFRGTLCEKHYRAGKLAARPDCVIPNCGEKQENLTHGLCKRHMFRYRRHGDTAQSRASDWGSREKHALYGSWVWHKRGGARSMVDEWRHDFWAFVTAVGERPEGYMLRKEELDAPIGPLNWKWQEPISNADKARYSREWVKKNPRRAKSIMLRKHYGIDLDEYEAMFEAQRGVCAICEQPEQRKSHDGGPAMMPVDHCHNSGKVRGLLCSACNRALGMFKENPTILRKAIEYVESHT